MKATGPAADAALRDANAIAERVAADEAAADAERERLTREPLPELAARDDIGFLLRPAEVLHAIRTAAILEKPGVHPRGGSLSLTSLRLVHAGARRVESIELARVAEMGVSMERLLLIQLDDGSDLAVEVDRPRLLRVQAAAARAAARNAVAVGEPGESP